MNEREAQTHLLNEREAVAEFLRLTGSRARERPELPSEEERVLRCRLLLEECLEYIQAAGCRVLFWSDGRHTVAPGDSPPDLAAMAQESADVRYIAHGNDLLAGVPPKVFAEVHRANLDKAPGGAVKKRSDGKILKPPGWRPPDVAGVLDAATGT